MRFSGGSDIDVDTTRCSYKLVGLRHPGRLQGMHTVLPDTTILQDAGSASTVLRERSISRRDGETIHGPMNTTRSPHNELPTVVAVVAVVFVMEVVEVVAPRMRESHDSRQCGRYVRGRSESPIR